MRLSNVSKFNENYRSIKSYVLRMHARRLTYRRHIDITTYQIRKIKADTSLCLFADDMLASDLGSHLGMMIG